MHYSAFLFAFQDKSEIFEFLFHFYPKPCIDWKYLEKNGGRNSMEYDIDDLIFGSEDPGPSDR